MNDSNKYNKFPAKAIREFLQNPTEETLDEIKYACFNLKGICEDCPFDGFFCPPPSGDNPDADNKGLGWYFGEDYNREDASKRLAELVLAFAEALSLFETNGRGRG